PVVDSWKGSHGNPREAVPMSGLETPAVVWLLATIQLLGLISAWMVRLSEGSRRQVACQWVFVGTLALAGAVAMVSVALEPGYWLASGTSLSIMVLAATCDCRKSTKAGGVW